MDITPTPHHFSSVLLHSTPVPWRTCLLSNNCHNNNVSDEFTSPGHSSAGGTESRGNGPGLIDGSGHVMDTNRAMLPVGVGEGRADVSKMESRTVQQRAIGGGQARWRRKDGPGVEKHVAPTR